FKKAREIAALSELGDAQLHRAGPRFPVALPVAVALGQSQRVLLAIGRPGAGPYFHLHQSLGGKADHLAQQIRIGALLYERAQVHHVIGHRWFLRIRLSQPPDLYRRTIDDQPQSRSLATALLMGALPSGFATAELHHL